MTPKRWAIVAAGVVAAMVTTAAHATQYASEYSITAFGLKIASTSLEARIDGDSYDIAGQMTTAGVVRLFSTTAGNLTASGAYSAASIRPSAFDLRYRDNGKDKRIRLGFNGGTLDSVERTPPPSKGADWIAVSGAQLADVVDPIAASLIPAASLRQVCDRTVRLYDGALRADIEMRYKRTVPFSAKGFRGEVVTCQARFVPLAGYNRSKRELTQLRDKGRIEASFAPVAGTNLYAPVKVRVRLGATTINITATRFEQLSP